MAPLEALDQDIDEESRDEMNYDEDTASHVMDHIYQATSTNPVFQCLYDSAAALMFSEDREIGLCVLFSYDYLVCFHPCLCCFFTQPEEFTEAHPTYIRMREKLG
jgi:hypothetical protein